MINERRQTSLKYLLQHFIQLDCWLVVDLQRFSWLFRLVEVGYLRAHRYGLDRLMYVSSMFTYFGIIIWFRFKTRFDHHNIIVLFSLFDTAKETNNSKRKFLEPLFSYWFSKFPFSRHNFFTIFATSTENDVDRRTAATRDWVSGQSDDPLRCSPLPLQRLQRSKAADVERNERASAASRAKRRRA